LLEYQYDNPDLREQFFHVVKHDVENLDRITEKLLNFASKRPYRLEYGDINSVIYRSTSAIISHRQFIQRSQQTNLNTTDKFYPTVSNLKITSEENLPLFRFDREQLENAIIYILVYLMNHMKNDDVISIDSNLSREGGQEYITLHISGNMCALPTEELRQIFDPFSAAQNTLIDVGPCVAKKIIDEHGGHLEVRQQKSGQAVFVVTLPVPCESEEENARWRMRTRS
jgi:K+-sensing histidine kinase KdpD